MKLIVPFLICCLALAGCESPQKKKLVVKDQPIKLRVMPGPKLEVNEPPTKGCVAASTELKRGCIVANIGDEIDAEFSLQQFNRYHIGAFKVCRGTGKPTEGAECELQGKEPTEFILEFAGMSAIPGTDGLVNFKKLAPGADLAGFKLTNRNRLKQDYFYSVQACPDPDTDSKDGCFWTDPPIQNKGIGQISH